MKASTAPEHRPVRGEHPRLSRCLTRSSPWQSPAGADRRSGLSVVERFKTLGLKYLTLELTPECSLSMGTKKAVTRAARIGEAAKETGLSIDTIRFYEKEGLLQHSARTEGGFRLFGPGQIGALKFIRNAQELGFSLNEIRELLILQREHVPACSHVKELLEHKLAGLARKIEELRTLERTLKLALRKCVGGLKAADPSHKTCCPVLDEISRATGVNGEVKQ